MSYKSTRIYDFKPLDKTFNFSKLVDNAIAALDEYRRTHYIEGYIGCDLTLVYPDLTLIEDRKGGWPDRVQRLTEKIHKRFSEVDWQLTTLRGNMFNVLDLRYELFPHKITTAVRKGKYQFMRSIQISVPLRESFLAATLVLRVFLQMLTPDWFQYADSVRLTTWANSPPEDKDVVVHDENAKRVPWKYWLRIDNYSEAIDYYSRYGIADIIAEECKGSYMNADKADLGERRVRRYLYPDGKKTPLQVENAQDVMRLVKDEDFHAFYTSCERLDGSLGKVCIDLDARWMLTTLLGPDQAWSLECCLVDAILAFSNRLGLPDPAIKFSGARGIHVYWNVERGAVGDEWIEIEPYRDIMYRVDKYVDKKKTTESYLRPFQGMKTLLQAVVLASKFRYMDWDRVQVSQKTLEAMGCKHPTQLITVGGLEDRFMGRLSIDILSQKKGVFRSVMNPHYKSGLVSRSIKNEFGQIGTQYRIWYAMRGAASQKEVMHDVAANPESLRPNTGTLSREDIERIADAVKSEVYMVAKFSPASASNLQPEYYRKYRTKYTEILTD